MKIYGIIRKRIPYHQRFALVTKYNKETYFLSSALDAENERGREGTKGPSVPGGVESKWQWR